MKILLTGGAGFIGSHTVDGLLERGHAVRILDALRPPVHRDGQKPEYLPAEAEFLLGDVRSKADVERALDGVDAVVHLAAYQDYLPDFSTFFHINSVGTALLYEVIVEKKLPVRKVVVASSQAVYGEGAYRCLRCSEREERSGRGGESRGDPLGRPGEDRGRGGIVYPDIRPVDPLERGVWEIPCPVCGGTMTPQWTDEAVVNPQNPYAISKYTQELIALNLGKRYGIPTVCMRYSIVQGPRQSLRNAYSGACRIFCVNLYFDRPAVVYEDGQQLRDFVNIGDVVRANLRVLEDPRADGEVFNVGGGRKVTVLEFARIVAQAYGKDVDPEVSGEFRFGDTRHIFSDIGKLRALGWTPQVPVEQSVRDYIAWLETLPEVEDVSSSALERMRALNVVRKVRSREGHRA